MAKGICSDGIPVDKKVKLFQETRESDVFEIIGDYYDGFRDFWYKQVTEYIEKDDFDREWSTKLLHSIETYDEDKAMDICRSHGWSMNQKFNRWFYRALKNWICNIKTQAYRTKRRPGILCPICYREVAKIEERHLAHIRSTKDVPRAFEYKKIVYKTSLRPKNETKIFECKLKEALKMRNIKTTTIKWPWFLENGDPGVFCPFTKKIVPQITDEYIATLPAKHKHYAKPYTWFDFQKEFPSHMIHSEVMSLNYSDSDKSNRVFIDSVKKDKRIVGGLFPSYLCSISDLELAIEYEHVINIIEKNVNDETDQYILKHIALGNDIKFLCDDLGISKKEFKERMLTLRQNKLLEMFLVNDLTKH